ncbi:UDP-N-acetylenolpyruvoylglucosamine reductase [Cutibacterium avidum]|uniref:UDP-N-acetylmuramate dehydrogenase n=1 Tax=Cutibacterium avidum TaxID=33010 RepID=UPI000BFCC1E2|nr:UDP-N-acetylmuramate dehydrogenase [Cutibacterium avidum]PGX67125.1 UDP-N-acetylenolpyruvoylglucosamine reductase [Cutibacterium avidum]
MSTTVIGPYEDDDLTEACSTIHHEAIGTKATLTGGDDVPLAPLTTFKVGGPARHLVIATTNDELLQTVRDCDRRGEPCLVLGGGSNVLVGDDGFDGTVVRVATSGLSAEVTSCGGALVTVAAGQVWDDFVDHAIEQEWIGPEFLSGIPGLVGSTPIQNVGAYGVEVCEFIARVRTWDRVDDTQRTFTADQCGFGYRSSRFKAEPDRYVVLDVTMQFNLGTRSLPVRYAELARRLGVEPGERANTSEVRETVLEVRGGKGMVLNPDDHDTWSAGSFFTNPLVAPDEVPEAAPAFVQPDGRVKTSAAWLIDHAGYGKGFMVAEDSPASLSTKHVLALTNRGSARSDDLTALARTIIEGVRDAYGITLVPEPRLVGCAI